MTNVLSRRNLLKSAGVAGAVAAAPPALSPPLPAAAQATAAPAPQSANDILFFFNDEEARFIEAAIGHLIPRDAEWAGAVEAGVLTYIDHQLASAFGAGGRMYLKGPWKPDAPPQQGYQLRFTPAELYRIGIEEARAAVRSIYNGREFWDLGEPVMVQVLKQLEAGEISLPSMPSPVFFETLLANTVEGFFADPVYGGNRDMVGWRMIGFPGAYAQYADLVEMHGLPYTRPPIGIADGAARQRHLHPPSGSRG